MHHEGMTCCYGTGVPKTRVHAHPYCPRLNAKRTHPIRELPIEYFQVNKLCKTCFKGQQSSLHVRCRICRQRSPRPCPHNGGVVVEGRGRVVWAWPEDAIARTLVNPLRLV